VRDALSAGYGDDVIDVFNKPAGKDVVTCGRGFDRVFADRADVVTPDCEKVFVGERKGEAFFESISESFFEGLNPRF
jgi:ATP:corrinoid adenosyltransferase